MKSTEIKDFKNILLKALKDWQDIKDLPGQNWKGKLEFRETGEQGTASAVCKC